MKKLWGIRSRILFVAAATVVCAMAPAAAASAKASAASVAGHVYVETNSPAGNQVWVWDRGPGGHLSLAGRYSTRGKGSAASAPLGLPITDSQGAVTLSPDHSLLFAVNTGSNSITAFRVVGNRLVFADRILSGGDFPVSVTANNGLLYVLNDDPNASNNGSAGHENINGYRYTSNGKLSWIGGSTRSLAPEGMPGSVSFDPAAQMLVVTERFAQQVTRFTVGSHGRPQNRRSVPSQGNTPFGLAVTANQHAIVADFGTLGSSNASVSSYDMTLSPGNPSPVNSVPNGQQTSCWVALDPLGDRAFISSALSGSITEVTIAPNGVVTPVSGTAHTSGPVSLDEGMTPDGRFLYVLTGNPLASGTHDHVEAFSVGAQGQMARIQDTASILPENASGLAAT